VKVTAIVPAFRPVATLKTATAPRAMHGVDMLARAVGHALCIEVPIVEGTLADAPPDGYLLVFELRYDDDPRLGPRIVAFNQDRSTIMKNVETFNLAAAVEKQIYFQWRMDPQKHRGYGLIGRKDIAERIQADVATTGPYQSARYAALESDTADDLVELLVAYLRAYSQVVALD
jgi:hypothetical protein